MLCCLLAAACGADERKVRGDFQKDHTDYTIISIGDRDGNDTSIVTFFITYKKPNDPREYWADWAYETKSGRLELVRKGSENVWSEGSP